MYQTLRRLYGGANYGRGSTYFLPRVLTSPPGDVIGCLDRRADVLIAIQRFLKESQLGDNSVAFAIFYLTGLLFAARLLLLWTALFLLKSLFLVSHFTQILNNLDR